MEQSEEEDSAIESWNAAERVTQERAFPQILRDLEAELVPRLLQQTIRNFILDQDIDWMKASLSFLDTHTIHFRERDFNKTVRVNAFAIGYHSAYFNTLFKYSQSITVSICLDWLGCIAPGVAAAITEVDVHGCHLEVRDETCLQLFMAADFMLYEQLRSRCLKFICIRCSDDNLVALTVWSFARSLYLPDLVELSLKCLLRNFQEIRGSSEFLDLDADALWEILDHRMLNCASELQVLQTIGQWAYRRDKKKSEQWMRQVERLLCCVRLGQLQPEQLLKAQDEPIVKDCSDYLDYLATYPVPKAFRTRNISVLKRSQRPRLPDEVALLLCSTLSGSGPGPIAKCIIYNRLSNDWNNKLPNGVIISDPSDPKLRNARNAALLEMPAQACCVSLGNLLFIIGGFWYGRPQNTVLCFDRLKPQLGWSDRCRLVERRYYHCCAVVDDCIYAIGGQQERLRLAHVERMLDCSNVWVAIDPLLRTRSEAAAVAYQGNVLVVGGFDGQAHLDTAEMYCPTAGAWTLVTGCMSQRRSGLGLVVLNDTVYALCGQCAAGWMRCVERFEKGKRWRVHCKMATPRSQFGCIAMHNRIYLFGGNNADGNLVSSEWVDPVQLTYGTVESVPFQSFSFAVCRLDLQLKSA